jgi:hypothetical protein
MKVRRKPHLHRRDGRGRRDRTPHLRSGRIQELQPWFRGDYHVNLNDGTELAMSRGYRQTVEERPLGV